MKLTHRRNEEPDISLTPLIDVVFLLLIFFMVSTTFTRESEITVNLPEANVSEVEREDPPIELVVDAQGRYYVNRQLVVNKQLVSLTKALKQAMGESEQPSLVISADAQTPHQSVVTAMDAARQLGIVQVSLATRQPEDSN